MEPRRILREINTTDGVRLGIREIDLLTVGRNRYALGTREQGVKRPAGLGMKALLPRAGHEVKRLCFHVDPKDLVALS